MSQVIPCTMQIALFRDFLNWKGLVHFRLVFLLAFIIYAPLLGASAEPLLDPSSALLPDVPAALLANALVEPLPGVPLAPLRAALKPSFSCLSFLAERSRASRE